MVDCIGFENRRSFTATEGSNPSLSEWVKKLFENKHFELRSNDKFEICYWQIVDLQIQQS